MSLLTTSEWVLHINDLVVLIPTHGGTDERCWVRSPGAFFGKTEGDWRRYPMEWIPCRLHSQSCAGYVELPITHMVITANSCYDTLYSSDFHPYHLNHIPTSYTDISPSPVTGQERHPHVSCTRQLYHNDFVQQYNIRKQAPSTLAVTLVHKVLPTKTQLSPNKVALCKMRGECVRWMVRERDASQGAQLTRRPNNSASYK